MKIKRHFNTFSEAIRQADGIIPQSFLGRGARIILGEDAGKLCAIEAGLTIMGADLETLEDGDSMYVGLDALYPYLKRQAVCPQCGERDSVSTLLWHLNDLHDATFLQIADWLESEEEKLGYVLLTEEPQSRETRDSVRAPELVGVLKGI